MRGRLARMALGLVGCAVLAGSPSPAQVGPPGLTASVAVDRAVYLPTEPIVITITRANVSGGPIVAGKAFREQPVHLQLLFTDPDGQLITTSHEAGEGEGPPPPVIPVQDELLAVDPVDTLAADYVQPVTLPDAHAFYPLSKAGRYSVACLIPLRTYPAVFQTVGGVDFAQLEPTTFAGMLRCPASSFVIVADGDGDGFAFPQPDSRLPGTDPTRADCNDTNAAINPGRVEVPGNGLDDDCNPATPDDPTPPVTTATVTPAPNAAGWNQAPVIVTLSATDGESGVKEIQYTLAGAVTGGMVATGSVTTVAISQEGMTTLTFFAKDHAGNQEPPNTRLIKFDKTAPTLTVPGNFSVNATSPSGAVVTYSATATDNLDPGPVVTCAPASGSTFPIGTTTVNCTATDQAGNSTSKSFTVTVKDASTQINDLKAKVQGLTGVSNSLKNSLITKLNGAQDLLSKGNTKGACAKLNDFIQQVQAQSGKGLTVAQADDLLQDANRIKAVVGCP